MNFKPTVIKVIISIILGVILGYFLIRSLYYYLKIGVGWQDTASITSLYLFPIGTIIVIYLIWSLIQKKK